MEDLSTKQKGDIAEQAAILQALKRGWGVLCPIGDRLPYDMVFDLHGCLVRIQVKTAWLDQTSGNYMMDTRRTKTNRRVMVRDTYEPGDFDFALVYLVEMDIFYVIPVDVFLSYKSGISLVEAPRRQRKPRSANYRDAWELIRESAVHHAKDSHALTREA